jgi:hypothetical protein
VIVDEAGSSDELPRQPVGSSSGWTFNWWGLVPVLLIVTAAVVGWRWIDGSSSASDDGDRPLAVDGVATTAPATVETTSSVATTTLPLTPLLPPTTTVAPERQVLIQGEVKPCRFGANCLVASFSIAGFEQLPDRYVCIYPNSRRDFGLTNDRVVDACLTADEGDTITIEVDGVRSATISEQNLDGAEPLP